MNVSYDNSAEEKILSLAAEIGGISRRSLDYIGICTSKRACRLAKLVKDNALICRETESGKVYLLTASGQRTIQGINPVRHQLETRSSGVNKEQAERFISISEIVSLCKQAGFATHCDDKPSLYSAIQAAREQEEFYAAGDAAKLSRVLNNPHNTVRYRYECVADGKTYRKRTTAMNCLYQSKELKEYISTQMDQQYSVYTEEQALAFSRCIGLLITPARSYRIYHTQNRPLRIRIAGENSLKVAAAHIVSTVSGKKLIQIDDVLIFGRRFAVGVKLLEVMKTAYQYRAARLKGGKEKNDAAAERVSRSDILKIKDLGERVYYLPLLAEVVPLLRVMQYPAWEEYLIRMALRDVQGADRDAYGLFDGEIQDIPLFEGLLPDLLRIYNLQFFLANNPQEAIYVICMNWARSFYAQQLEDLTQIRYLTLSNEELLAANTMFEEFYEGGEIV